jgi:hypothetical protein
VEKLGVERVVELPARWRDVHIDNIVEWSSSSAFRPHIAGQHLAGYDTVLIACQVFEKIKLASRRSMRRSSRLTNLLIGSIWSVATRNMPEDSDLFRHNRAQTLFAPATSENVPDEVLN